MTLPRFERIDLAIAIVGQGKMTGINTVATGSLTAAIMHPREVFMPAVIGNAVSIICGHNNPSGDLRPSDEDNGDWIFVPWLGVVLLAKIRPVHPNRGLPFETSNKQSPHYTWAEC
jgi:hypothetical protein